MIIKNIYDVSLFIGDVDILDGGSASKVQCTIEESIYNSIPMCKIVFLSSPEFVDETPIIDGTKVQIKIASESLNIDETIPFRVMKMSAFPHGNDILYSVECVIDFYELFRTPIKYSMNNNSSEIFKLIADQNGLANSEIYTTQDKQLWSPSCGNLYQWMNYITQHSWASQQSAFFWALSRNKKLIFADIDRLVYNSKNISKFCYGDMQEDDIKNKIVRYKNMAIEMNPGPENLFNKGYDGENNYFDLLSYSTKKVNANKVRAVSEIININKELSFGLGKNISQFNVGNHHPNFFTAEVQNRRILSTFSTYVYLFSEFFSPINIAQVCFLEGQSHNTIKSEEINTLNIKYIISKIQTKISSSNINMNIELCSQGYNGKSTESY